MHDASAIPVVGAVIALKLGPTGALPHSSLRGSPVGSSSVPNVSDTSSLDQRRGEVEHTVDAGRGITIHSYDWGGTGPTLVLAHATGLHAHVWQPLVARLRSSFHCIGVDLMAQGSSTAPTDGDLRWDGVATGLVAVLDDLELSGRGDVYAVGHSQGGFAVIEAELRRPGTFAAIFAYEPVIFPSLPGVMPDGTRPPNPMAVLTRRRRRTFVSHDAAVANFSSKPPFKQCDPEVIESYVRWGFRLTGVVADNGDAEIGLVCSPETEGDLFEGVATDVFPRLPDLRCPVVYGLGDEPGNFSVVVPLAAENTPQGRLLRLPGRTHFGILEGTDQISTIVTDALLGSSSDAHHA